MNVFARPRTIQLPSTTSHHATHPPKLSCITSFPTPIPLSPPPASTSPSLSTPILLSPQSPLLSTNPFPTATIHLHPLSILWITIQLLNRLPTPADSPSRTHLAHFPPLLCLLHRACVCDDIRLLAFDREVAGFFLAWISCDSGCVWVTDWSGVE